MKKHGDTRSAQVGTMDRSEKIRTYNFPQDRITDHRIKQSWGNLEGMLKSDPSKMIDTARENLESPEKEA